MKKRVLDGVLFGVLLLVLGVANFGWVIYPPLGSIWGWFNGIAFLAILLAGIATEVVNARKKHHGEDNEKTF